MSDDDKKSQNKIKEQIPSRKAPPSGGGERMIKDSYDEIGHLKPRPVPKPDQEKK